MDIWPDVPPRPKHAAEASTSVNARTEGYNCIAKHVGAHRNRFIAPSK